jgi:hypothetical protein
MIFMKNDTYLTKEIETRLIADITRSIEAGNLAQSLSSIQSIIPQPFDNTASSDPLSLLYQRFLKNTDIPLALPVFSMFGLISAWFVKNEASYTIPLDPRIHELNTWVMALAETGEGKTLTHKSVIDLVPKDPTTNKPIIEENFPKPNGGMAMIQSVAGLENNKGYWFLDEASQFLKQIEHAGSPLSECREYLLKLKDGSKLERNNAKEKITIEGTILTAFFINTFASMASTLTDESMTDGLFRRFQVVLATKEEDRKPQPLYDLSRVFDSKLKKSVESVFEQQIQGKRYTFTKKARAIYEFAFTSLSGNYQKIDTTKSFFRTYMMESWKYAIFHHFLTKQKGTEIGAESMNYGLKVSVFMLDSLLAFGMYRAKQKMPKHAEPGKTMAEKIMAYIAINENQKGFGIRELQRKFSKTKKVLIEELQSIKVLYPNFSTKFYEYLPAD